MPVQTDTVIQFSGLKSGFYDYDFTLGKEFFEGFENEDLNDGEVHFQVNMEKKERLMLFHISFDGMVKTQCDRCLGMMEVPVEDNHLLTVRISDKEQESEDEDVVILPDSENSIDLAQWLYEYVVIALPLQHVHPDDENGNSTCDPEMLKYITAESDEESETSNPTGEIDPRWAKLMDLKQGE